MAVAFRHDVGLEFARDTIFLEPSGATLFHEALDCERDTIGCGDLIERREPGGATVTVLPGAYRRSYDGAPPDLANATFTNAFISASISPSSVTWASELPYADAAQNPRVGCDGATHAATFGKDGICDAYFNCAQSEFDGGDCP